MCLFCFSVSCDVRFPITLFPSFHTVVMTSVFIFFHCLHPAIEIPQLHQQNQIIVLSHSDTALSLPFLLLRFISVFPFPFPSLSPAAVSFGLPNFNFGGGNGRQDGNNLGSFIGGAITGFINAQTNRPDSGNNNGGGGGGGGGVTIINPFDLFRPSQGNNQPTTSRPVNTNNNQGNNQNNGNNQGNSPNVLGNFNIAGLPIQVTGQNGGIGISFGQNSEICFLFFFS